MVAFRGETDRQESPAHERCSTPAVTLGRAVAFDGAEVCQLVGAFVLATLSKAVHSSDIGLHRDDGLGALRNTPGTEADRIRKDVMIFGELGLRITIQTNLKVADFLDVTLNLDTESYYPYRKPNDRLVYIHCQSNHPQTSSRTYLSPSVAGSPTFQATRLCLRTPSHRMTTPWQTVVLVKEQSSSVTGRVTTKRRSEKNRRRNITWFNPPFSRNVATIIGWRFHALVNKHFPKGSKLNKIFNRNTLKLSYSCMPNMSAVIRQHNRSILKDRKTESE